MSQKQASNSADIKDQLRDTVKVTLTLNGATAHILWNRQIPLLDALLNAGIHVPN